ncbi:hypothetical protein Q0590_21700 [Rhodocytophaga aerolata]|uniref:Uncharacterized protein n=1 Tax=Rhodocytophaga aerolata TaxID=455078 RepID=A0ABT8R9Y2_9BACT|nr:hypothetical protein [Rhodocytophaga aerolata]MDO1448908.1 hypothetical protein [Rhodocytophaga aerolata]
MPDLETTVNIVDIDWFLSKDPPEGSVLFRGKNGGLITAFSYGQSFAKGETAVVYITSLNASLSWEVHFSENRTKKKELFHSKDWEYEGYGQIKSINPVVIDFGDIDLETGYWTNDIRIIGEYIYWKIERLSIIKKI